MDSNQTDQLLKEVSRAMALCRKQVGLATKTIKEEEEQNARTIRLLKKAMKDEELSSRVPEYVSALRESVRWYQQTNRALATI